MEYQYDELEYIFLINQLPICKDVLKIIQRFAQIDRFEFYSQETRKLLGKDIYDNTSLIIKNIPKKLYEKYIHRNYFRSSDKIELENLITFQVNVNTNFKRNTHRSYLDAIDSYNYFNYRKRYSETVKYYGRIEYNYDIQIITGPYKKKPVEKNISPSKLCSYYNPILLTGGSLMRFCL